MYTYTERYLVATFQPRPKTPPKKAKSDFGRRSKLPNLPSPAFTSQPTDGTALALSILDDAK